MHAGRTTNIASIISLLGAFLAAAMVMGLLAAGLVMPAVGAAGAAARSGVDVFDSLPTEFTASPLSQQSRIVAAGGEALATPYEENRVIVPLANVAPIMRKAQVAIEDSRFYEHGGVDVRGVVRALASNAAGTTVQGGSTLTQQYVKLMLQETALKAGDKAAAEAAVARSGLPGLTRKLQELKYSIQLEKDLTKDQILQGYFNLVYYGDQAYGVEAAAKHYFDKSSKDLTLPEAALIAGLAQNPGTTDPVNHPDKALARRNVVLDRMYELGAIQEADYTAAKAVPLAQMLKVTPAVSSCASAGENAYFCDYTMRYLLTDPSLNAALGATQEERKKKIYGGGLTIVTTLDASAAQVARDEIQARVPRGNDVNIGAAAVTLDPATGAVRAMAQNTKYNNNAKEAPGETSINWGVDTRYGGSLGFQFGSTEKAFALVTALERGMPISSTVDAKAGGPTVQASYTSLEFPGDSTKCGLAGQPPWKVKNDGNIQAGRISLTDATAKSVNTAFVQLVSQLGACNVRDTETRMGLLRANGEPMQPFPSAITLGTDNVSPMTVASAYGSLGNNGIRCSPVPVSAIRGPDQKPLPVPAPGKGNCKQVVDPDVAHGVAAIMSSVLNSGGTASTSALANGRPAAGKTGTSDRNNETWFAGYTPQLSTAVWVGTPNDMRNEQTLDNVCLNAAKGPRCYSVVHGSSVAAPMWKDIMDRLLSSAPVASFPAPSDKIVNGELVAVDDVIGHTVEDATASLEQQGFPTAVGRRIYSSYRPGIVAGTEPSGQVNRGSLVTLLISAGPGPATQQLPPLLQQFQPPAQSPNPPQSPPTTPPGLAAPPPN